jgi:hypothetical protein
METPHTFILLNYFFYFWYFFISINFIGAILQYSSRKSKTFLQELLTELKVVQGIHLLYNHILNRKNSLPLFI